MKQIREIIREAEDRWLKQLYMHCRKLFAGVFLPSHDHLHHARVWSHARSLLLTLDTAGMTIPEELPGQLLIASFFHDTGLIRTPGEKHGKESRLLCEDFFNSPGSGDKRPGRSHHGGDHHGSGHQDHHGGDHHGGEHHGGEHHWVKSFDDILYAIEHHDDKSLKTPVNSVPDLLRLLSTSDDLDAFGLTGIYRYAEIFLLRGMEPEQLPRKICTNVRDRFENIRNSFGHLDAFIKLHESRFRQVYEFYLRLGQAYASRDEKPSWEPVLIEIFRDSIQRKENLLGTGRILPGTETDNRILEWFNALDRENPGT